jgi:HEAT repeat protein
MQRGRLPRWLRIVILPLAIGPIVSCSDRCTREPDPLSLESVKDLNLRQELADLRAAQTSEQIKQALDVLRSETDSQSIPFIMQLFRHPDPDVAITAVETVEFLAIATPDGIPAFSEALTWDLPSAVRKRVVEALYEQRTETDDDMEVATPLLAVLERDPDPLVRIDAVLYIGSLGAVDAAEPLRKRLDAEKDDRVRQTIEWAIRFLRDETTDGPPKFDAPS